MLYIDPNGEFAFIPLLLVAAAGGFLGGIGYYAIQTYLNGDQCNSWDWGEALFWSSVGTGFGVVIGVGIYGGWWAGTQLGWWRVAKVIPTGGTIYRVYTLTKQEMEMLTRGVDLRFLDQATSVVKETWTSASATYGRVTQYIVNYYINGEYIATIHKVETLTGEVTHMDFKTIVLEGIKYIVK